MNVAWSGRFWIGTLYEAVIPLVYKVPGRLDGDVNVLSLLANTT